MDMASELCIGYVLKLAYFLGTLRSLYQDIALSLEGVITVACQWDFWLFRVKHHFSLNLDMVVCVIYS